VSDEQDQSAESGGGNVEDYPDEVVAAVKAAQLRLCTQEVPEGLAIRLPAAAEAKAAGVREWYLAGNREARPVEAPFLRVGRSAEPKKPSRRGGRRKQQ
jgi:hypothetical protein